MQAEQAESVQLGACRGGGRHCCAGHGRASDLQRCQAVVCGGAVGSEDRDHNSLPKPTGDVDPDQAGQAGEVLAAALEVTLPGTLLVALWVQALTAWS